MRVAIECTSSWIGVNNCFSFRIDNQDNGIHLLKQFVIIQFFYLCMDLLGLILLS